MRLKIEPRINVSNSESDFVITNFYAPINVDKYHLLSEEEYNSLELEDKEYDYNLEKIGYVLASRLNYSYDKHNLLYLADNKNADISFFASFLLLEMDLEDDFDCFANYIFYIETVFIEPKYRGHNYGLKALSMFLQLFAQGEVVGCHPFPISDLEQKYSQEQGKKLMRRYWSKVGFDHYSEKNNILWTKEWYIPEWLKNFVFQYEY